MARTFWDNVESGSGCQHSKQNTMSSPGNKTKHQIQTKALKSIQYMLYRNNNFVIMSNNLVD